MRVFALHGLGLLLKHDQISTWMSALTRASRASGCAFQEGRLVVAPAGSALGAHSLFWAIRGIPSPGKKARNNKKVKSMKATNKIIRLVMGCVLALGLTHQTFAIEGLKLQIHCPHVLLSWPSTNDETYIVQYRATLDTNSTWLTLTNFMPPTTGTNMTYFVHSNRVDCPAGQVFGMMMMSGDGGTATSSKTSTLSEAEIIQIKKAREEARLAALYEKCKLAGREPYEWELKNQPPLPPSREEIKARILAAKTAKLATLEGEETSLLNLEGESLVLNGGIESNDPQPENGGGGGGASEPGCGFYRVVRNGVYIVGLTNSIPLSGTHSFILEVGLDDSFASVVGFSISQQSDDNSVNGIQTPPLGARIEAVWETTQTTNGVYNLIPEVELADGTVVTGAVKTVTVQNNISFPNGYQVAGDAMYIQAHTIHTNGTWHMNFFNDQNTYLGFINGNVSAEGFCDYPGVQPPGFSVGLLDVGGNQIPSSTVSVAVTTTPSGGGSSTTATNKVVVERSWEGNRKWAIAYQTVYQLDGTADLQLRSMMGEIVGGIQEGPYGNNSVVNATYAITPNPFKLRFSSHWGQLSYDLATESVRNFFYFGHGAKGWIGNNDINTSINRATLQFLLQNSPNPLVGTNKHPYRFVFLDGCDTAKGDLVLDFGIPKQTIYATNMINRYGLKPRAFLGWKTKVATSVTGTLPQSHKTFINRFFEIWPQINPTNNNNYTLREALDKAAIDPITNLQFTTLNEDITIYGCPDLYFYD